MAQTHDTIDGLLAEFRGYSAGMPPSYHVTMSWADFRRMLDRLEAAHKRERGDVAKLREALGKLRAELWNNTVISGKRKFKLYEIADAALAKPARNCDVHDKEEVRMAYHLHGDGLMSMQAVVDWLYSAKKKRGDESPRTEQKGKVRG